MSSALLPSELFLCERWDEYSEANAQSKRASIFKEYVALGFARQQGYRERYKSNLSSGLSPTEDQRSIVELVRTPEERHIAECLLNTGQRLWVRTCYAGQDIAAEIDDDELFLATLGTPAEGDGVSSEVVLNDELRYNFGNDWQSVFTVLPEVVECVASAYSDAEERRADLQQYVRPAADLAGNPDMERENCNLHHLWVTGWLWVQDTKATTSGYPAFIWLDEIGRVIRETRVEGNMDEAGALEYDAGSNGEWWNNAKIGDAYKWGAFPPLIPSTNENGAS